MEFLSLTIAKKPCINVDLHFRTPLEESPLQGLYKTELSPFSEFRCRFFLNQKPAPLKSSETPQQATEELIAWLKAYAQGKPFPLPFTLSEFFSSRVLIHLTQIPFASTQTYSEIAQALSNPKGARAVGNACRENPLPLLIPCHRVVRKNGDLGGFNCGIEIKQTLLDFEEGFR